MYSKSLLRIFAWLSALVISSALIGPLVFAPQPGTTLTRRFTQDWRISLDDLRVVIDDQDWTELAFHGFEMNTELSQLVVVTDTYHSVRGGRPQFLDRYFDTISQEVKVELDGDRLGSYRRECIDVLGTSDLQGRLVEFRRVKDGYDKDFDRPTRREDLELLEGLTEDMDLRILLPPRPVEVGDSWDIELESLADLLSPGGYLSWNIELEGTAALLMDRLDPALMGDLRKLLGRHLRGEASVTYVRESGGHSELAIGIDIRVVKDLDDLEALFEKLVDEAQEWDSLEVEDLQLELNLEATGIAHWDSARGHISDLELSGELDSTMELVLLWDFGQVLRIEIATQVSAEFEQGVAVD